jgi:hypothetical protein
MCGPIRFPSFLLWTTHAKLYFKCQSGTIHVLLRALATCEYLTRTLPLRYATRILSKTSQLCVCVDCAVSPLVPSVTASDRRSFLAACSGAQLLGFALRPLLPIPPDHLCEGGALQCVGPSCCRF